MQADVHIFGIWKTWTELANDISENPDKVRKWKKFRRIPQEYWQPLIDAASRKRKALTIEKLFAFNTPPKQRGRPRSGEVRA